VVRLLPRSVAEAPLSRVKPFQLHDHQRPLVDHAVIELSRLLIGGTDLSIRRPCLKLIIASSCIFGSVKMSLDECNSRTIDRTSPMMYARPSRSFARTCRKFPSLARSSRRIDRSSARRSWCSRGSASRRARQTRWRSAESTPSSRSPVRWRRAGYARRSGAGARSFDDMEFGHGRHGPCPSSSADQLALG